MPCSMVVVQMQYGLFRKAYSTARILFLAESLFCAGPEKKGRGIAPMAGVSSPR